MHPNNTGYCRYLRGKNAFGSLEGGEHPFLFIDTDTTTYWCLRTTAPYGPDGNVAHITTCGDKGRDCFRAGEEMEEEEK